MSTITSTTKCSTRFDTSVKLIFPVQCPIGFKRVIAHSLLCTWTWQQSDYYLHQPSPLPLITRSRSPLPVITRPPLHHSLSFSTPPYYLLSFSLPLSFAFVLHSPHLLLALVLHSPITRPRSPLPLVTRCRSPLHLYYSFSSSS